MAKKEDKEVAKRQESEVPAHLRVGKDGPRGSEQVRTEDLLIPRLEVCQSLSPVRKKTDPAFIEGIEEGHLFDSITGEFWNRVLVIPVYFRPEFLIWKDRQKGGGFRGGFAKKEEAVEAFKALDDREDCEIQDHHAHYCLLFDEESGDTREIALSMARSKMAVSKRWNSMVRLSGLDRFARVYELGSTHVDGAKGDYYQFTVKAHGFTPEEQFHRAEKLYDDIRQGVLQVRVDQGKTETGEPGDADEF